MKPIDQDYQAPENDLTEIEDGVYSVEAVEFMAKSIDEKTKKPHLIDNNFGPVAMMELSIVGKEETIPMSCRLSEIPYLVQAFTGDTAQLLPPVPALDQLAATENYLILAVQLCNQGAKRPTMTVKKGWGSVYRLSDSGIPKGSYHGYFTDITTKNALGLPAAKASSNYPDSYTFDGMFLVVADRYGEQFGWSGVQCFQKFMKYKATTVTDEHGNMQADWLRGKKTGKYTTTAQQFSIFVDTTGPSLFANGNPRFADPANICPEWLMAVQRDKVLLTFDMEINEKGYRVIDIPSIMAADPSRLNFNVVPPTQPSVIPSQQAPVQPVAEPGVISGQKPTPVPEEVPSLPDRHLLVLIEMLNLFIPGDEQQFVLPFVASPKLMTPAQLEIVKTYIAPLKEHLSTAKLNNFTLVDVGTIFENLPFEHMDDTVVAAISGIFQKLETSEQDAF